MWKEAKAYNELAETNGFNLDEIKESYPTLDGDFTAYDMCGGWIPDFLKDVLALRENLSGDYVIDGYEGNKNDWHYVSLSWDYDRYAFTWRNRAGREWTLKETD